MFRHIVAALALLVLSSTAALAQVNVQVAIDKSFVPCSGTTDQKTIHMTATCIGAGCTAQHRVRFTQTGPIPDSDGDSVYSQSTLATVGPDFMLEWSRLIHCDEWGFYNVRTELVQPSSQGSAVLDTVDAQYEATYRAPLRIASVDSFTQNSCSSITMGITVKDQDNRTVEDMPIVYELTHNNGAHGANIGTTGHTVSTSGKVSITVPILPAMNNGGGTIEVKHVDPSDLDSFLDPFFFNEVFYVAVGCP